MCTERAATNFYSFNHFSPTIQNLKRFTFCRIAIESRQAIKRDCQQQMPKPGSDPTSPTQIARILFFALLLFPAAHCDLAVANQSTDQPLTNVGFENGINGWSAGNNQYRLSSNRETKIEGERSLEIDHGDRVRTTGISQTLKTFQSGQTYTLSIAAQIESGQGTIELVARFDNDAASDVLRTFKLDDEKHWQTYRLQFTIPPRTRVTRIFIRTVDSLGETYIDQVKFKSESENWIINGGFENILAWRFIGTGQRISSRDKLFGRRSLKLSSANGEFSQAQQLVWIPTDTPTFTLSANIRPDYLEGFAGGGAGFRVVCRSAAGEVLRRLEMPLLTGNVQQYVHRSVSFLVPQDTRQLLVQAVVLRAIGTAYFDNVRLESEEIPLGDFIGDVGARPVSPPDFQTGIDANQYPSLQSAADSVALGGQNEGRVLWVPPGRYHIPRLIVRTGAQIKMHPNAVMVRSVHGDTGFVSAFFRTPSDRIREDNVILEGGTFAFNQKSGQVVNWRGNRWIVRNMNIPAWSIPTAIARAVTWFGNDSYIYQNNVRGAGGLRNPAQESFGGIIMAGGNRAHIMGNWIHSGDDAVGLFTTTTPYRGRLDEHIPSFNQDIRDVEVHNNILNTSGGRGFACGLPVPRFPNVVLDSIVENVRVRNGIGLCGGKNQLLTIQSVTGHSREEVNSGAQVRNIRIEHLSLTGDFSRPFDQGDTSRLKWFQRYKTAGIYLYTRDHGSMENIFIDDVRIKNVSSVLIHIRNDSNRNNRNMQITNSVLNAPFRSSITNSQTGEIRRESTHRFIARATKDLEINDFEQERFGNILIGGPYVCWDQNKDGICDRR